MNLVRKWGMGNIWQLARNSRQDWKCCISWQYWHRNIDSSSANYWIFWKGAHALKTNLQCRLSYHQPKKWLRTVKPHSRDCKIYLMNFNSTSLVSVFFTSNEPVLWSKNKTCAPKTKLQMFTSHQSISDLWINRYVRLQFVSSLVNTHNTIKNESTASNKEVNIQLTS